jgi:hypothetical protein
MIEAKNGRLVVNGHELPPTDVEILKHLSSKGELKVTELMLLMGKIFPQYISSRVSILASSQLGVVVKKRRGTYEIVPELQEELKEILEKVK